MAREAAIELEALNSSGQALCDIVLGAGRGSAELTLCHDEARCQLDPLSPLGFGVACLRPKHQLDPNMMA